ncbi:MAG: hypothetical protein HFH93_04215 [Lachnospiraceae bacterium]|nr:hypothetical protein [Lachnospiraceae bacterium]
MKKHNTHELGGRLLVTILILAVYMAGRSLLLYRVDPAAYQLEELNSDNIMISMISGDRYQYTLFALGIMPYIMSTLVMWILTAVRSSEAKARSSPRKTARFKFLLMIAIAFAFAVSRAEGLVFKESSLGTETLKAIAVLEMTIGAVMIHGMAEQNKEHGIGAQMPIILVNILDNLVSTVQKFTWSELYHPLILCFIMSVVILVMENIIIRIRVQRVSIHNEYADKSYIAFKLDPIGIMPVMFAVTFLMLLKLIINFLIFFFTDKNALELFMERLDLTDGTGVIAYLGIIFTLNTLFSFIMLSPGQMAEHLQKGGDSIVGIYAGKKTKRYLRKRLITLCAFSGIVLCTMMGVSLGLALEGKISSELALLPATAMILTSITCALCREVKTYWKFDSYSFFL